MARINRTPSTFLFISSLLWLMRQSRGSPGGLRPCITPPLDLIFDQISSPLTRTCSALSSDEAGNPFRMPAASRGLDSAISAWISSCSKQPGSSGVAVASASGPAGQVGVFGGERGAIGGRGRQRPLRTRRPGGRPSRLTTCQRAHGRAGDDQLLPVRAAACPQPVDRVESCHLQAASPPPAAEAVPTAFSIRRARPAAPRHLPGADSGSGTENATMGILRVRTGSSIRR